MIKQVLFELGLNEKGDLEWRYMGASAKTKYGIYGSLRIATKVMENELLNSTEAIR